jgi:hypothetical protein
LEIPDKLLFQRLILAAVPRTFVRSRLLWAVPFPT